jgi:septum formation protein
VDEAGICDLRADETRVLFSDMTEADIQRYVASGEPMDKAGAYGAQGKASLFVESITGDFFNVMGLPLCALGNLFKRLDVKLL